MADLYFVYRGEGRGWSLTSYKEKHKVKGNLLKLITYKLGTGMSLPEISEC